MKLTIDNISQILRVPTSTILEALAKLGINHDENQLLSEKEIKKLRPVLFRYYQSTRIKPSEESSNTLEDSSKEASEVLSSDEFEEIPDVVRMDESEKDTDTKQSQEGSFSAVDNSQDISESHFDSFLEELVTKHIIMLDTCSIMHEGCGKFIESICPILKKYNKKIVIPNKVIEELKKHNSCWDDPVKAALAEKGLQLCETLKNENCLSIRGGQYDNFADNVFFVHFSSLRFKYNMVLITQDYKLSKDILQLNNMKTSGGNPVKVFKLSNKGSLIEITE